MSQKTIAVIDDDKQITALLTKALGKAGYDVLSAYDGQEAVELIKKKKPDLVILDILMPKDDGYTVLKKVKTDKHTQGIPVIMLTALGMDEDIQKGIKLGAEHYLIKPLRMKLLLECIRLSLAEK